MLLSLFYILEWTQHRLDEAQYSRTFHISLLQFWQMNTVTALIFLWRKLLFGKSQLRQLLLTQKHSTATKQICGTKLDSLGRKRMTHSLSKRCSTFLCPTETWPQSTLLTADTLNPALLRLRFNSLWTLETVVCPQLTSEDSVHKLFWQQSIRIAAGQTEHHLSSQETAAASCFVVYRPLKPHPALEQNQYLLRIICACSTRMTCLHELPISDGKLSGYKNL